jgi:hypothetical protein
VNVTDSARRRYSLEAEADNSYDAAHLYLTQVIGHSDRGRPIPTSDNVLKVVTDGEPIPRVHGGHVKRWNEKRRNEWNGPRGLLFRQRPVIGK